MSRSASFQTSKRILVSGPCSRLISSGRNGTAELQVRKHTYRVGENDTRVSEDLPELGCRLSVAV
jgi:hypothetical protein